MSDVARRIDQRWQHIVAQLRHQAETGTTAAIITSTAEETPMSEQPVTPAGPLAELKSIIGQAVAKAEEIDETALNTVRAINAHPELKAALEDLGAIAEVAAQAAFPAGWIADAVGGLRFFRNAYAPKTVAASSQTAAA